MLGFVQTKGISAWLFMINLLTCKGKKQQNNEKKENIKVTVLEKAVK